MVKRLILRRLSPADEVGAILEEVDNLLTDLFSTCLPNLQDLEDDHSNSYIPVLNALLGSGLKHLKRLSSPTYTREKSDIDNYATCALLMKDRIENITVREINYFSQATNTQQSYLNRLYYQLNQFSKLEELEINMPTNNDIQVMEHAIGNCKTIKDLKVYFYPSDQPSQNERMSIDAISNVTPANNIERMDANVTFLSDYKALLYLMHKFPQANHISINMSYLSTILLDRDVIVQLMDYLSRIESFYVYALKGEGYALYDAIGDYWDATATLGKESFLIRYAVDYENGPYVLDISKLEDGAKTSFNMTYPLSNLDFNYTDFIEKSGKYIGEFQFSIETDEDDDDNVSSIGNELPEKFFAHTFTHCPNLKSLYLEHCILKALAHSNIDFRKRLSLDELYLDNCFLRPGALDQLSLILPRLKRLGFYNLIYNDGEDPVSTNRLDLQIFMPHTTIDFIILEGYCTKRTPIYIKVFVVSKVDYHYYRFDSKKFTLSSEEEYANNENYDQRISICCQNQPELQFRRYGFTLWNNNISL